MVLDSTPRYEQSPIGRSNPSRFEAAQYLPLDLPPEQANDLKPLVSIVAPAYNEASIIQDNLFDLCRYLEHLESEYRWELIVVNDGSRDNTGALADDFARSRSNVHVVHHQRNAGLGQALRSGFERSQGDYIITMDLDLSYSPDHIEALLLKIQQTGAKLVVTSPYMKGGKVSNVPYLRLILSIWANRFLSITARHHVSTLTGMVRVYDAEFLKMLNLRSTGMDINPEIVHKAMLLGAKVEEIPAHLHWRSSPMPVQKSARRKSSMKILSHIWATFYYGFVFRPVMFFIVPSLFCFALAFYSALWMLRHCWMCYQILAQASTHPEITGAIALAFERYPHTFFIGGMTLMVAIQLFSLGVLAVQNKRYFEEIFYLGTAVYRATQRR
jgi:glycosyltransferase involved in cell wall biosynthesis